MTQDLLLHTIALSVLLKQNIRKMHALLNQYGSALEAWQHIDQAGRADAMHRAEKEMEWIAQHRISTYYYRDADYPQRLAQCPDAPILLYGKGNIHPNQGRVVSVVGTRSPSERGKEFTRRLVHDLCEAVPDITIVSGLAYGIDVEAHRAALEAQVPTLVIPGHGLDRIYPAIHRNIAVRILEQGGLLTEYTSGTEPERYNFVARDRIIAGMADAVVVVESRRRGGSLITARMARDYDRDLFAVPGRPGDESAEGCNLLIQHDQAHLLLSAEDLINEMNWQPAQPSVPRQTELPGMMDSLSAEARQLMDCLMGEEEGVHINSLVMETRMDYHSAVATLTMLELEGLVRSLPGGLFRAIR